MAVIWTEYHPNFDADEPDESYYGCYGFVNGTLYLGETHHALIISEMINGTYPDKFDWESLANAKQVWGWYELEDVNRDYWGRNDDRPPRYVGEITFASDDAKQSFGLKAKLVAAFKEAFPGSQWSVQKNVFSYGEGGTTQENYGQRAREQYLDEGYETNDW